MPSIPILIDAISVKELVIVSNDKLPITNNLYLNFDMAAKRRKKHKNKISGLVISICYDEQKSKF
jgi:hypothetical protein